MIIEKGEAASASTVGATGLPMTVHSDGRVQVFRDDADLEDGDRIEGLTGDLVTAHPHLATDPANQR